MTARSMSHSMNSAVVMLSANTSACSGCPDHQVRAAAVNAGLARMADPCSLSSPSPVSGPVTVLCSTQRGSRRRSAAFLDQAMAPISSWPLARQGSTGLIRGDPSGRTVPSIATGTSASLAAPRRAISGAPCSRSRQHAKSAAPVTAATVLLVERVPAGGWSRPGGKRVTSSSMSRSPGRNGRESPQTAPLGTELPINLAETLDAAAQRLYVSLKCCSIMSNSIQTSR
jgi:hypothetical protein